MFSTYSSSRRGTGGTVGSDFVSLNTAEFPVNIKGVVAELSVYAGESISQELILANWA